MTQAEVVICGAGIAGIATAHALAVTHGVRDVLLVDERAPLTLTSDKSTEAYRNWWPGPDDAMVQLVNRSIDLLEQWSDISDDRFGLNRRGYLYATRDVDTAKRFVADAQRATEQGAGAVRTYRSVADAATYQRSPHRGFRGVPGGADLFLDTDAIRQHFPWMHHDIIAVLHARRCGWFSGQQLGMYLLEEAKAAGVLVASGASSVPALAAAIIDHHLPEFERLELIEHGITPANGYDPGVATTASIMPFFTMSR
jgi:glycine/D-amino acid oxidase-like deaminating enzyme